MKFSKVLILAFLIISLFYPRVAGQDVLFSQTNYHQVYINPAYAGNSPYPRFMAGYRNQWPGLGNAFVSYYISYDQYVKSVASNFGISLNRDIQGNGTISRTSGEFAYSYPVEINNNTILSLGLQLGIVQKSISGSNLSLPDPTAGEVIAGRSKVFPDFSGGLAFYIREQYLFGISVHHVNKPLETDIAGYNYITPMQINMQIMARYPFSKPRRGLEGVTLTPGIYGQFQNSFSFITWGSNISYRGFITGIWLRNNLSVTMPTVIIHAGFSTGGFEFVYSYDAWMPQNYQQFKIYGAHEVTFVSHFKYNDPKRKMRTIKCPDFSR